MDEFELTRRALAGHADPAALERVRSRLAQAIEDERHPRRGPWRAVFAAAAAVGLVVLVIALVLPMPTAAATLRRMGAIAATQEPVRPGPGEYLLLRSEELRREGSTFLEAESVDLITRLSVRTWVASDGQAFRREEVLWSRFASELDRETWIELGQPPLELPRTHAYGPGEGPIHDVAGLPNEPEALLAALRSRTAEERSPGDDQVFILIGEILAQGVAPPELRSGLFEVAARLGRVALVGEVEDPLDRSGTAVELTTVNSRIRLVFDADAAQLLAIEVYSTVADDGERLSSWTAFEPTIVVDEGPPLER